MISTERNFAFSVLTGSIVFALFLVSTTQAQQFGDQKVITTNAERALSVYAADLTGNGRTDVLSASDIDDKIAWYENQGDGAFSEQKVITTDANGAESVHAADLTGNGKPDVLSASFIGEKIMWYENQGGSSDLPSPPTGLTASSEDCQISLTWNANTEGDLSGYNLYRSTDPFSDISSTKKINDTLIQNTSYSDSDLGNGPTYYYRVTAVDTTGAESPPSGAASAPWKVFTAAEEDPVLIGGREALQDSINYPEFAEKAGIEGRVRVQFTVNEAGDACSPTVTKEAHPLLNNEAPKTIKRVEFDPALEGGEPVKFQMTLPVIFSLTTVPTGLTASQTYDQVSLSWDGDPENELSGFNVYRSTSPFDTRANAQKINDGLVEDTPYEDSDVTNGTTYYYRLTGVDSDDEESLLSAQVSPSLQSVQLLGLEVNQSVQTWENDIMPLVEGKKTIVRAHLQNKGEGSTPVQVKLKGTQNGSRLPGSPKSAFNADNFEAPPSPSEDSVETIRQRRAHMDSTLNFELPSEWLEDTVTLKLVGDGVDCDETPVVNIDCELQVTFEPIPKPEITFFNIGWRDGSGNVNLPDYNAGAIQQRLQAMYPISDIEITVSSDNIIIPCENNCGPPDPVEVFEVLANKHNEDSGLFGVNYSRIYYGFVNNTSGDENGSADLKNRRVGYTVTDAGKTVSATTHEVAHLHGLQHAVNEPANGTGEGFFNDRPLGYCGSDADPSAPDFPYVDSTRIEIPQEKLEDGWTGFTALGPKVEGLHREVWGVNTETREVVATSPYREDGPNAELMSYCQWKESLEPPQSDYLWTSDTTYATLRDSINARFDVEGETAIAAASSQPSNVDLSMQASSQEDYLVVKGRIDLKEDILEFRSFSTLNTTPDRAADISPNSGGYTLQALDESGNVIEEVSFEPSVGIAKKISDTGFFSIPIQADPGIEEVKVLGGGGGNSLSNKSGPIAQANNDVLGSKSASPNPPTVTVQYPNGGEDLGGDEVTLEWTADDPDGDSLSYTVKYSRNGGSTWKALATSWPRDSLTVDTDALGGTGNGLIRVQASDGFNTTEDQSDAVFGTSNVPPNASIFSPSDGAVTGQSGLITLDGSGSDTEDGSLSGPALKWQTASGDSLGIGETIDVSAANFSLGTHTIELVATDSVGASDTASVSIQVSLSNDPSLLASASALVESDSLRDLGPTGTNIDFVGTSGAATVTAELYDSAPIGADGIPQSTVSQYRVLVQKQDGLTIEPETTVRFETDILGGINDPTEVQIYWRLAPSNGPFTALDTQVDSMGTPEDPSDDVIYAETSGFGEFVLASNSQPLPVELSDFDATLDGKDAVRLTWTTAQETGNAGFRVQRNAGEGGEGTWTTVGSVEGSGTTTEAKSYRYIDEDLPYEADRLTYRLKQVDTDGSASYSKEVTVERSVKEAQLLGTYPNPAQQRATVRYAVPERQGVKIYLYDILGQRVQTVVDGEREGRHKRQLDVSRLASGVYFLRLRAEGKTRTQKLTVIR